MAIDHVASHEAEEESHLLEYWHVVLRRRRVVVAVFLASVSVAVLRISLTRSVYQATASLVFERENPKVIDFKEVEQVNALFGDEYYVTQNKLLQSRVLIRTVIEELDLLQDPEFGGPRSPKEIEKIRAGPPGESPVLEKSIDNFLERLRVQWFRNSRVIAVSFEAYQPELAARVANRLSQAYIEQVLQHRYQASSEAAQWLAKQIDEQRRKVEAAEQSLQAFKQKEGIVNIEERRSLLEQRLKDLGGALTSLKTQRLEREALYEQMKDARNAEELPEVMRSPVVQSLRIELANLERQLAQLQERYLDQHPEIVRVRNQIQETRQKIAGEAQRVIRAAENDYKAAAAQEASVASALEAAKAEALDLSRRGVVYDSVKRELEANKVVLNSLLARHKETDVAQALKAINIHIVDPAVVPRDPVRPKPAFEVALGVFLGLGLALGLAFLLEHLDNTLKTPEDVRQRLKAPLLAAIPELQSMPGQPNTLVVGPTQQGPFIEGYRLLRTALHYSWPEEKGQRVVCVTSTAPGEGKTLTAVNLALTLAFLEGKVLLLDGDLRRSQAHAVLRAKRVPGLADVLVGHAKISEAVQRIPGTTLSFLSAGTAAPSPADLLTVSSFKRLVESLRDFYSWIIIDTPPVGAVADPLVISAVGDGVVLVAGAEMIPYKAVHRTLERVAETGARILGVVLNRAQIERHHYYYGYHYGHHYTSYQQLKKVPSVKEHAAR